MNFVINSVLSETPKFVDLGFSPTHTTDKLKSIIAPPSRAGVLTDNSNWIASMRLIAEVTEGRLSKVQAYSDYIKNSEFETRNFF